MKLKFNINNEVEMPELILGKKNYDKIGSLTNIKDFTYERHLSSANMINLTVHKELDGIIYDKWDEIKDNRLIWIKDFDEWFQITVSVDEEQSITKKIVGTDLCAAELGQYYVYNMEINTEDDIARDNYEPTIFYNPDNPNASLLHRVLKSAPNYSIKYVAPTLCNIQRTFSVSSSDVYSVLTNTIAQEINCLFIFDSSDRSLSVYDLYKTCKNCGYRGNFDDECPECGSKAYVSEYGEDTPILIDRENLGKSFSLEGKFDEVKNCFRVVGGDDLMTATIANCLPNGSNYIVNFSKQDKEDMSEELSEKLNEYYYVYNNKRPEYLDITERLYNLTDDKIYLISEMMPDIETDKTISSEYELNKLTTENLSPVAISSIKSLSLYTANSAVLGMAKCVANSKNYKITIVDSLLENTMWYGKFKVVNYSDEEDFAENDKYIQVEINDDYEKYINQKIEKTLDNDDKYLVQIFNVHTELDDFKNELTKYCLNRLISFENAYQTIIDVLVEGQCGNTDVYPELYDSLYIPYYNKLSAIQYEMTVRERQIENIQSDIDDLTKQRKAIQKSLNMEAYLGEDLWKELYSFRREDTYENSNYISDGLNNKELIQKAQDLITVAQKEILVSSTLRHSISGSFYNLLAIKEFQPIVQYFEVGNWIRVRVDEQLCKLRLIGFTINFESIQDINVEFSDVINETTGCEDITNITSAVQSMSSSYDYVARQAEQGAKSYEELTTIKNEGLKTNQYKIETDSQKIVIDEHGILARSIDSDTGEFSPKQLKIVNNLIAYTTDGWKNVRQAIGEITYTDPITKDKVTLYGMIADAVVSGYLIGNTIVSGEIYSSNYVENESGTYINLDNGEVSFCGGKMKLSDTTSTFNVGDWSVGDRGLYKEYDIYRSDVRTHRVADDHVFSTKRKDGSDLVDTWYVQADGYMYCIDGHFEDIEANDATINTASIGGFVISDNNLSSTVTEIIESDKIETYFQHNQNTITHGKKTSSNEIKASIDFNSTSDTTNSSSIDINADTINLNGQTSFNGVLIDINSLLERIQTLENKVQELETTVNGSTTTEN